MNNPYYFFCEDSLAQKTLSSGFSIVLRTAPLDSNFKKENIWRRGEKDAEKSISRHDYCNILFKWPSLILNSFKLTCLKLMVSRPFKSIHCLQKNTSD